MPVQTHLFRYKSPLGTITVELNGSVCHRIVLESCKAPVCSPDHPVALWLRGYFHGKQLPLPELAAPKSKFQGRLRQALLDIARGQTCTYGELAKTLNSSPQAVGQALGANPLPILIPCHRVVAADGLGGFSGGERWKRKLLAWEGVATQKKKMSGRW